MIRYALKCDDGHGFESWFASAEAFDALDRAGRLECPQCGTAGVHKALMSPGVGSAIAPPAETVAPAPTPPPERPLAAMTAPERALEKLRREIQKNSDYVGNRFAAEARRMHLGDAPERAIHGEAPLDEARQLIEDGIPILPLPFRAGGKTN